MSAQPAATDQSAAFALLELTQGSVVTQAIYVAAKLGIADMLGEGPLSVEEIAKRAESVPEATHRLLQTLSGYSVFAERDDGRFELTPMASALRADAPTPMRDIALLMGHPLFWEDWGHLMESVQTGEASMPKVRGMGALEFLMANPDYAAAFLMAMANLSDPETDPIAGACDFSRFGKIIDVGGGRGA